MTTTTPTAAPAVIHDRPNLVHGLLVLPCGQSGESSGVEIAWTNSDVTCAGCKAEAKKLADHQQATKAHYAKLTIDADPDLSAVDFFREREKLTWRAFLLSGKKDDLEVWRWALRALQLELDSRVRMVMERAATLQTPGKAVTP